MAKSLRSKVKRRIRQVRRAHYYEVEGKHKEQEISNKLNDPTYDFKKDGSLPPNAFVDPENPNAVFPQHARPKIIDFRSHKMAGSGFSSRGAYSEMLTSNSIKSKYATIVQTPEEVEAERVQKELEENLRKEAAQNMDESDDEIDMGALRKAKQYTVDDITMGLEKQMKIQKKKKKTKGEDMDMQVDSKAIKKPEKNSRN